MHFETFSTATTTNGRELAAMSRSKSMWLAGWKAGHASFLLRSLLLRQVEIPGRFSSSLPPPSFARGRSAAIFPPAGAAPRGTGLPAQDGACAA